MNKKFSFILIAFAAGCAGEANDSPLTFVDNTGDDDDSFQGVQLTNDPIDQNLDITPLDPADVQALLDTLPKMPEGWVPVFDSMMDARRSIGPDGRDIILEETEKKANVIMLQGWAIYGNTEMQDGVPGAFGVDACTRAGLTCDNHYHNQARITTFGTGPDIANAEFMGACGSAQTDAAGIPVAFMPCLLPYFHDGVDSLKYKINLGACGSNVARRTMLTDGYHNAMAYIKSAFPTVAVSEVTGGANVEFICATSAADIGSDSADLAKWRPANAITLRFGAPQDARGAIASWADGCDTAGLPGSTKPPKAYFQFQDMVYTYDQSIVALHPDRVFAAAAKYTTNQNEITRYIRNIAVHEIGHLFGFQHDSYTDPDLGIMRASAADASATTHSRGFHSFYREAVSQMSMGSARFEASNVWDEDIACFKPLHY